jgi:hypothetical protein
LGRRSSVGDSFDGAREAVEGVGGDGGDECGLVPLPVVADLEVEGVVEGALQGFGRLGQVQLELR